MTFRNALAAALVAGAAFTSLGGVASAQCEPFPLGSFCDGWLPGREDIPEIDSDLQCTYNPDTGVIECS